MDLQVISFEEVRMVSDSTGMRKGTSKEVSDYSKFEVTNGAGQLTQVGVVVRGNVTAEVSVNLKVTTISQQRFEKIRESVYHTVTVEQKNELEKHYRQSGATSWWLGLFGISSGKSTDEYQSSKQFTATATDDTFEKVFQQAFEEERKECQISGKFSIKSNSNIPTEAFMYAKMLKITTASGEVLKVFNNTAIPADASGKTKELSVEGDNVLNIMDV